MDVELVLHMLQEAGLVRLNKITGDWYQCYCPFHNNGAEKRASCGVLVRDQYKGGQLYKAGMWHCFTCSYVNSMEGAITDILAAHDIDETGAEWLSKHLPGYSQEVDDSLLSSQDLNLLMNKFAVSDMRAQLGQTTDFVPEEELAKYRFTVPYMYERKLTDAIIAQYDIGYDANWIVPGTQRRVPCITFPIRDVQGRTLFICRRSVAGKLYNYPKDVVKPVYGLDQLRPDTKSVIICESCINALTAVSYGYQAVALLGTCNSYQMKQLRELGVNEYVLCMDGDPAGRKAATRLARNLSSAGIVWTIDMPDGKDLNDCTKEEFDQLYSMRR